MESDALVGMLLREDVRYEGISAACLGDIDTDKRMCRALSSSIVSVDI